MPSPSYPVQFYPQTIRAKDGHELVAKPLRGEAVCVKCDPRAASLTIVGYLDRLTGHTWPTCYGCAREAAAAKGAAELIGPPNPHAFVPYDEER